MLQGLSRGIDRIQRTYTRCVRHGVSEAEAFRYTGLGIGMLKFLD